MRCEVDDVSVDGRSRGGRWCGWSRSSRSSRSFCAGFRCWFLLRGRSWCRSWCRSLSIRSRLPLCALRGRRGNNARSWCHQPRIRHGTIVDSSGTGSVWTVNCQDDLVALRQLNLAGQAGCLQKSLLALVWARGQFNDRELALRRRGVAERSRQPWPRLVVEDTSVVRRIARPDAVLYDGSLDRLCS